MVNVAVLGYGVVGGGVAQMLTREPTHMTSRLNRQPKLGAILDIREFPDSPYGDLFVKDFAKIEERDDIRIVAETIGGVGIAKEFTERAIKAGKHVVTSNKELVATHGDSLMKLAREHKVNYLFEASVGGGIPVIRPLSLCLSGNRILEICGILNGTTNYILTQMENSSTAFSDALTEAQRQGYAEADPSSDIKGTDACRKIAILSSLAFGRHVDPNIIPTRGISDISQEVTQKALSLGGVVRLLARSRVEPGGDIAVHVEPYFVPSGHPFHSVRDVFNAIVIVGDATGPVLFSGRGAGRMPTASAVMGDIYFCANHLHDNQFPSWESSPAPFLTLNPFESEETVSLGDLTLHIVPNFFFGGSGC